MSAQLTQKVRSGEVLSASEMEVFIGALLDNTGNQEDAAELLIALSARGETSEELRGACDAVMSRAVRFDAPENAIDVCGTGGDGKHTRNISTTAAFIIAACGVPVVKHGNRGVSSRSGSSDVLSALGINHTLPITFWQDVLATHGIAFLYAPMFHAGLGNVADMRKRIGTRTIFNLLGPLCNPARVNHQLMGVYDASKVAIVAQMLKHRGVSRAWVVHGRDGGDEVSIAGDTLVADVWKDGISTQDISPAFAGLSMYPEDALIGGTPQENAHAMESLFTAPTDEAYAASSILNAAVGLVIAGRVADIKEGAILARAALDSGEALLLLRALQSLALKAHHD